MLNRPIRILIFFLMLAGAAGASAAGALAYVAQNNTHEAVPVVPPSAAQGNAPAWASGSSLDPPMDVQATADLALVLRLDLAPGQRRQLFRIARELHKRRWALQGDALDHQYRLWEMMTDPSPDPRAVGDAYAALAQQRRRMIEATVEARNRFRALLTERQRRQLRDMVRRDWGIASEYEQ